MAHINRYYIVKANDPNLSKICEVIVGKDINQRYSLNGEKLVVKLNRHDHNNYDFLSQYQEYNHGEILYIMQSPEWTKNIEQDA